MHYLAHDCGTINQVDLALAQSLAPYVGIPSDRGIWSLLPVLGTMTFLHTNWKKSSYIIQYESFRNNEHCIQLALSKLFICCYGKETINDLETSLLIISPNNEDNIYENGNNITFGSSIHAKRSSITDHTRSSILGYGPGFIPGSIQQETLNEKEFHTTHNNNNNSFSNNRVKIAEYDMRCHSLGYLTLSAKLLYLMTNEERLTTYGKYPITYMMTCLELFVRITPLVYWSDLKKYIPYSILHSSRVENILSLNQYNQKTNKVTNNNNNNSNTTSPNKAEDAIDTNVV